MHLKMPKPRGKHLLQLRIMVATQTLDTQDNLSQAINLAARACFLSRAHFSRLFKDTTGLTPRCWHMERRVVSAERLLETTSLPLSEIAYRCGFSDQSHFTNAFVKRRKVTPGTWRRSR
jgi:AraC family transcriptional regulator